MIDSPPLVALKTIKILFMYSKVVVTYLLNVLMHDFPWLMFELK